MILPKLRSAMLLIRTRYLGYCFTDPVTNNERHSIGYELKIARSSIATAAIAGAMVTLRYPHPADGADIVEQYRRR
jgi:hypothetical protein